MKEIPKLTATSSLGRPSQTYRSQHNGWLPSSQGTNPGLVTPSQLEDFQGMDAGEGMEGTDETNFADEIGTGENAEDLESLEGLDAGDGDESSEETDLEDSFDENEGE